MFKVLLGILLDLTSSNIVGALMISDVVLCMMLKTLPQYIVAFSFRLLLLYLNHDITYPLLVLFLCLLVLNVFYIFFFSLNSFLFYYGFFLTLSDGFFVVLAILFLFLYNSVVSSSVNIPV